MKSDEFGSVHAEATQRRAPSPIVKPDVLALVHMHERSCWFGQTDVGNDAAMKSPRQRCAQVGISTER